MALIIVHSEPNDDKSDDDCKEPKTTRVFALAAGITWGIVPL